MLGFVMFCWASGASPECYALATRAQMAESDCARMLPQIAMQAIMTPGMLSRIEAFGDEFEITDVGCYTFEQVSELFQDKRLK